jgi:hypothetical protein
VRARLAWSLLLPALVVAEHAGHVLVHRLQEPDSHARAQLLAQTGHGYMGYFEHVVWLCLVLVGAALINRVVAAFRNKPFRTMPSWWWACVPAAAFVLQESLGEVVHAGVLESAPLLEPLMALGFAVELLCGLACVFAVRKLLVAAHRVGRALAEATARRPRLIAVRLEPCGAWPERPRLLALARGIGERAPPAFG